MSESVHISQASFKDLNETAVLFNDYRVYYGKDSDLEGAGAFLYGLMEHRESVVFLARGNENGKAAGFAQLYPVFSSLSMQRSWILNDLYVAAEFRNQGIGHQLLAAVSDYAVFTKSKGIALETGVGNLGSQRLYEQCGYVRDDEFYHYFLNL
ncbi:GNAT family acetyltransferase [Fontibacillus phaseoli]|uniref:GNAT family acetyltransferase n=1 Tax=Fontibacillus phaseoli TaxID=1416533 RepID=A0A369BVC3_9BACL|nr:GNAT family N-acetyltransferase [Fontibacillus phaseoli]RCX23564.1 GNAT family acetyltransferase [Fontibacillus phaseoli]